MTVHLCFSCDSSSVRGPIHAMAFLIFIGVANFTIWGVSECDAMERPVVNSDAVFGAVSWYSLSTSLELGLLIPMHTHVQFGRDGVHFDPLDEQQRNRMLPYFQIKLEALLARRHAVFVSQGTHFFLDSKLGYLYHVVARSDIMVGVGVVLQSFQNVSYPNPELQVLPTISHEVGAVPILRFRARYRVESGMFIGMEIDGVYWPRTFFRGMDVSTHRAAWNASGHIGARMSAEIDSFFTMRYVGGNSLGANGTVKRDASASDNRWFHGMMFSLGVHYNL